MYNSFAYNTTPFNSLIATIPNPDHEANVIPSENEISFPDYDQATTIEFSNDNILTLP